MASVVPSTALAKQRTPPSPGVLGYSESAAVKHFKPQVVGQRPPSSDPFADLLPPKTPASGSWEVPIKLPVNSEGRYLGKVSDVAAALLAPNKGLFIGETHDEDNARRFVIDNMSMLRAQGVKVLFLEWFELKTQALLDAYQKATTPEAEDDAVKRIISCLEGRPSWPGITSDFIEMLKAAKSQGVSVHAIDDLQGPFASEGTLGRDIVWRNQLWARTAQSVMQGYGTNDKFIMLGGFGHAEDRFKVYVPLMFAPYPQYGVDLALRIPTLRFNAYAKNAPAGIYQSVVKGAPQDNVAKSSYGCDWQVQPAAPGKVP
jgi:hypothetical protein